jgi:hypothetical protein
MKIKLDSKNTENAQSGHSKFPVELSIPGCLICTRKHTFTLFSTSPSGRLLDLFTCVFEIKILNYQILI